MHYYRLSYQVYVILVDQLSARLGESNTNELCLKFARELKIFRNIWQGYLFV